MFYFMSGISFPCLNSNGFKWLKRHVRWNARWFPWKTKFAERVIQSTDTRRITKKMFILCDFLILLMIYLLPVKNINEMMLTSQNNEEKSTRCVKLGLGFPNKARGFFPTDAFRWRSKIFRKSLNYAPISFFFHFIYFRV